MPSLWFEGDLCIHKNDHLGTCDLGFIKSIDPVNSACTIESCTSHTDFSLPPDELIELSPESVELLTNDDFQYIESIDANYFKRKLTDLISSMSGVQKVPRRRSTRTPKSKAGAAWSPGKFCICTWSEDENYYFATISEADMQSDRYLVRFCHYGNTEWKSSYELHELGSDFEPLVEDECNKLAMDKLRSTINSHSKPVMKTTVLNEVEKTTDKCATALTLGSKLHESSKDQFDKPRHAKLSDGPLNPSFSHESGPQFAQDILAGIEQLTKYTAQQSPLWNSPSGSSVRKPHISTPPASGTHANALKPPPSSSRNGTGGQTPWQALLISWFMCGYHTGYFEALHFGDDNNNKNA